jgi:uncharacterized protein (TIGR00290 family)
LIYERKQVIKLTEKRMKQKPKAVFNWSGGKDSAFALQKILKENEFEVVSLLTTINKKTLKSSMHSIPVEIISQQAKSVGIPLYTVMLSEGMNEYEEAMRTVINHFKNEGINHFIFGDIFLNDIRTYRQNKLHPFGIEVVEPLWNKTSKEIIEEFLQSGIKAKVIVTQANKLNASYVGKELDRDFIRSLPENVDICGENGEYHTIAYAGGLFMDEIKFSIGKIQKLSYNIKLDNGEVETFEYWQAEMNE